MEASSRLSPATSTFDNMASPQQFLKLEDVHAASSPSQSYDDDEAQYSESMMQNSPPPVIVKSQQAKKRKSWGQTLPEPKTMLPPRKRAKTDDEKEQRRIERIKRNRAAAHNSRERKRQEAETLAVLLAHANAELDAYRRIHGPLPASVVLPEVQVVNETDGTPAPSLVDSHGTAEPPSPASPPDTVNLNTIVKQEPSDNLNNVPYFPPAFDSMDPKQALSPLDPTQHSAVSVERASEQQQQPDPSFNDIDFTQLVGHPLPLPHDPSNPDLLQDPLDGNMDSFAFTDGAYDASFSGPLDFSFDDFVQDPASVAVSDGF